MVNLAHTGNAAKTNLSEQPFLEIARANMQQYADSLHDQGRAESDWDEAPSAPKREMLDSSFDLLEVCLGTR